MNKLLETVQYIIRKSRLLFLQNLKISNGITIKVFLIIVTNFIYILSFCQMNTDSLKEVAEHGKEETDKVNALNDLCYEFSKKDLAKAKQYGQEALKRAKAAGYLKGLAGSYERLGIIGYREGDYKQSLLKIMKALELYNVAGDKKAVSNCYHILGAILCAQGNFPLAIKCDIQSLKINELLRNKKGIASCYVNIGNAYANYMNYPLALNYYKKALKNCIENNYKELATDALLGIGNIYNQQHVDSLALKYYLQILNNNPIPRILSLCLNNIATIYAQEEKYSLAIEYFLKSLNINDGINDKKNIAVNYMNIAHLYEKTGNYNKAIKYADQSLKIANEIGSLVEILNNADILAECYAKTGNYKKAFEYHKYVKKINDSIFNKTSSYQIKELEAKYQTEKREKEIIEKNNKIALLEQREIASNFRRWSMLTGFLIIISVSLILVNHQKKKIKLNKQVFEAQKQLAEVELHNERLNNKHLQTENLLSESELNNERIKSNYLQKELDYKKREIEYKNMEIINFAIHIAEKNEFINRLKAAIEEKKELASARELILAIDLNFTSLEKERKEFEARIEQISHSFFLKLKEKIPDITKNEERLVALLRLNLSSKEIAMIFNISAQSVQKYRYILRKKLNIGKEDNLCDYLNSI